MKPRRFAYYHLHGGQMLLPPQELLVLRPHGRQHVVRVHEDVYERIDQPKQRPMAA